MVDVHALDMRRCGRGRFYPPARPARCVTARPGKPAARQRPVEIANKGPVHRTPESETKIPTRLAE